MSRPSGAFSFPPPPPPPPPKFHSQGADGFHAPSRGRGFSHGQRGAFQPNRGRGYGRGRGGGGGGGGVAHIPSSPRSTSSGVALNNQKANLINQPHKRSFGLAFGGAQGRSRPQAPPAVPSFNASLESLLPSKSAAPPTTKQSHAAPKRANILGLTPRHDEGSGSEDDGDEEVRLAPGELNGDIRFEYKGNVSTLRTPADIAAWIAERRRRYPTQAKREAAQKEAEERKKKAEEERRARQEAQRHVREQRERDRKDKSGELAAVGQGVGKTETAAQALTSTDQHAQARLRAEKLRRKLEKVERTLTAINQASKAEGKGTTTASESAVDVDSATSDSDLTTSSSSSNDDTSSSDSDSDIGSNSDSDSVPEELSSKVEPEDGIAQLLTTTTKTSPPLPPAGARVCSFYARGVRRCKYGDKCRFSHVRTGTETAESTRKPRAARSAAVVVVKRKGLWDVLVEKEREDENRKVLQAIIALGDAGMLEEKET